MAGPPSYPGVPRWVKVSGIIALVLVVLIVVLLLGGGGPGRHGPGRHMSGSNAPPLSAAKEAAPTGDNATGHAAQR